MYVLPIRWTNNPNDQPISGNVDPDYVAPAGVKYNNIEAKFQLSFKTKVIQRIFGDSEIYGLLTRKHHIGKSIIMIVQDLLENLIMSPN